MNNSLDNFINWYNNNTEKSIFNDIVKKNELYNQIYYINFKIFTIYNIKKKIYLTKINDNQMNNNLITKSDECKIKGNILFSSKPDYILIANLNITLDELKKIPWSIFHNSNNSNNLFIKNYLDKKMHSLIISKYQKKLNFYEYSLHSLLEIVYDNDNYFELLVKYILLNDRELNKDEISKLEKYIKIKSLSEYYFMHKYMLKTPKYVIRNIIDIIRISDYQYKIRYNEKVYLIRYLDNFKVKKRTFGEYLNSSVKLLSKWYIYDVITEFEKNIVSYYNNSINNIQKYTMVTYLNSFSDEIKLLDLVQKYIYSNNIDKNLEYIFLNTVEKFNYDEWINKYFNGDINDYIQG